MSYYIAYNNTVHNNCSQNVSIIICSKEGYRVLGSLLNLPTVTQLVHNRGCIVLRTSESHCIHLFNNKYMLFTMHIMLGVGKERMSKTNYVVRFYSLKLEK